MTYVALYAFRIPAANVERFLAIQREAAELQRRHGGADDVTYTCMDSGSKYGLKTLGDVLGAERDEVVLVEVATFRDRSQHDEVMARIDADPRIGELYREVTELVDLSRCVRSELEQASR